MLGGDCSLVGTQFTVLCHRTVYRISERDRVVTPLSDCSSVFYRTGTVERDKFKYVESYTQTVKYAYLRGSAVASGCFALVVPNWINNSV